MSKYSTSDVQYSGQGGYMALMSAIIIAGVLLAVVFTMSIKGFMTRFNLLDHEHKKYSLGLAEACAGSAILKVIENNSYTGPEILTINGKNCTIVSVGPIGSQYLVKAQAVVQNAVSNVKVTLNSDFSVAEWEEVPGL